MTALPSHLLRRALLVVSIGAFLLAFAASAKASEPWGERSAHELPVGTGSGQVDGLKLEETTFAAAPEGNYFVAEPTVRGEGGFSEFRIQQFVAGKPAGSLAFSGQQKVKQPEATETIEALPAVSLTVDPVHKRVYVLESFSRREADKKEEEETAKGGFERFPLDNNEPAAGALYAFEYTSTGLKEVNGDAPVLNAEQLGQQSEEPKGALLNPRGMAVDPRSGDVVVTASEDIQANLGVESTGKPKQCRAVAQYIVPTESGGVLTGAGLGHRYSDTAALMDNEEKGEDPCGEKEEEGVYERTPLSPAITPAGRLLVYFDDEANPEGVPQIWEFPTSTGAPPTVAEAAKAENTGAKPRKLYDEEHYANSGEQLVQAHEVVGANLLSLASEGGKTTLFVNAAYVFETEWSGAPNVLHLTEPAKATEEAVVRETGFTAGASVPTGEAEAAPRCGIVDSPQAPAQLAALTGGKYLVYSQFKAKTAEHVEVKEFGEGGSTTGCPAAPTTTPEVETPEEPKGASHVPIGQPVTLRDVIGRREINETVFYAGFARNVEWVIKYHGPGGATETITEKQAFGEEPVAGEVEFKYTFSKVGSYEISAVITTNNLGHPAAVVSPADTVKANVKTLSTVQMHTPSPEVAKAHEESVQLEGQVAPPAAGETLHLTRVSWSFGDGTPNVEENLEGEAPITTTHLLKVQHHTFNRCTEPTCEVTLVVEGFTESGGVKTYYEGKTSKPVTVTESTRELEEEAEKRKLQEQKEQEERETTARKAREAQEQQEGEQRARQKHEEEERNAGKGGVENYIATAAGGSMTVASNGTVPIKVTCPSGTCTGTVQLQATVATTAKRHGKTIHKSVKLTIGSGSFSVAGGKTATVLVHLSSQARAQLARAHKLSATLTITSRSKTGATSVSKVPVSLKAAPAKKKKHK
jgi:hypothetical protein